MSNMPLIPASTAPVTNNASSQNAPAPAVAGAASATPEAAAGAQPTDSATPGNFAKTLLDLRNASLLGKNALSTDGKGEPLGGDLVSPDAEQAALAHLAGTPGQGLPLSGEVMPLHLPTGDADGGGHDAQLASLADSTAASFAAAEPAKIFSTAAAFSEAVAVRPGAGVSAGADIRSIAADQNAAHPFAKSLLRARPQGQWVFAQTEFSNGRADALLPTFQASSHLNAPQFTSGVIAAASSQMATPILDATSLLHGDMSAVNSSQMPSTLAPAVDFGAPRAAQATWVTTISAPVGSADWDTAMGEHVKFMAKNELNFAEIRVTPPQLGPIEVRLTMQHDQAQVTLFATHAATRDALEAALPRLRDMFADAGLNLTGANVASESFAEQRGRQGAGQGTSDVTHGTAAEAPVDEQTELRILSLRDGSALDVFA